MKKAVINFWYYHKIHIIAAAVVLAAGCYMLIQHTSVPKTDYDVAVVSPVPLTAEQEEKLTGILSSLGEDCTGDGVITVQIHSYAVDLGAYNQDSTQIGALDADLSAKISGLFLLADPEVFQEVTNGICEASETVAVEEVDALAEIGMQQLFLAVRNDCEKKYAVMFETITA